MQDFFLGIVEITLGMTILILLMLPVLRLIGGKFTAKCRYILWTLVLFRLAVPLSFGILPALIEVPVEAEPEPLPIQILTPAAPSAEYIPVQQNPVSIPPREELQVPVPPEETSVLPEPDPLTWEDVTTYLPHIYLTGAAVFLLWNLLAYVIYTGKILRSAKPADAELQKIYTTVCRKKELQRPPVLLISPAVSSPAAFGLIRRRIVLPDIAFTENALVGTLSHEVTHCKRGDLWIKAVCLLARSMHWFNPLVHLAAFRCEMEMELSCDEAVLSGCSEDARAVYGEIMLDIIRRCRNNRGALTTHFNPKKNAVKARLQNILYGSGKRRGTVLIVLCVILCLIAGAVVACRTEEPEDETVSENTEVQDESLPETPESGEYPSMEAYVNERMAQNKTVTYYSVSKHSEFPDSGAEDWTAKANITDTKLTVFEKKGEVAGLSEKGVLECWEYRYLLKLDVPPEDVMTVDGDFEGWFDMNGQHTVVALRYPDGTYTILMDEITGDGIDFTGYHETYEESIFDWYVTEYDLDLPLYVEDWADRITSPNGDYLGNQPVHRFDGDGWGIYIPVSAWYSSTDAKENQWIWCSSYLTGSMLTVDACSHPLEEEYTSAENQGYVPADKTNRIWELQKDDIHSYYYYYSNPNGGFWRVSITWTEEAITDYPYIAIEPQVLRLMAESFVVFGSASDHSVRFSAEEEIVLTDPDTVWQDFLDNVVAPYSDYIVATEFLDLDGNGIDELLLYDLGNGICEIYTIEGGEVKCLYNGTSLLTIYSDTPAILAPPSLGATAEVFYALPMPENETDRSCKNWFVPSPLTGGSVLYSTYGHLRSRTSQYFYFYSGEDSVFGKVLCVEELSCFKAENNGLTPETFWDCWYQGEQVTKDQYFARLEECWDTLERLYGVTYNEANTLHLLDELRKAPDTSFELLADLLDTLKTEDPQAYISRELYGEIDPANRYAAWGFSDDKAFAENLAVNYTFEPLTAMEVQETARITLYSPTEGEWTIHGWVNSNYIELVTGGQSYFFRAAYKYGSDICFGDILNNWFDQAEYASVLYQAVITDTGQGFLAAAQTFVESWYNRNLQVSSGSEYAFSYVSCSVRDAENREHIIQNGFIGEDTYTYYITVIFVPENPHAGRESMAGNTGLYTENDPAVSANAYEFYRIGYITLEEDGWHGEVGGTGW